MTEELGASRRRLITESVGIADGCRIGGDGYGPVTMQQYNSWNGIVWRNDPDHCDIRPHRVPAEVGNVRKTKTAATTNNDTIIRPALASIAGCMLMLSDKPEVYQDEKNLIGIRRSSPVLFSVPGQLYDFDASKTDLLKTTERSAITSGSGKSPIDGDQHGKVCPWWLNEFNLPFDHWNVLHRLNWSADEAGPQRVRFQDLGLDAETERRIAVVGVPDEQKGEAILLLSTIAGPALEQECIDLRYKLLDEGLSSLWCPKHIIAVSEIPVLSSGKLDIKGCEALVKKG